MSRIITVRFTDNELSLLRQKAQIEGVTISSLLRSSALADRGLSIIDKQGLYIYLNKIKDYARQLNNDFDDKRAESIIKEVDELWKLLN